MITDVASVGVFSGEGPPVPIPNTEVKLTYADDTCLVTGRENRSTPTQKEAAFAASFFLTEILCVVLSNKKGGGLWKILKSV